MFLMWFVQRLNKFTITNLADNREHLPACLSEEIT